MLFNARASAGTAALKALGLLLAMALHLAVVVVAGYPHNDDRITAMVCAADTKKEKESAYGLLHGRKYTTN
jgi:hypothetical protein